MKEAILHRREGRKGRNKCDLHLRDLWMLKNYRKKQESKVRWDLFWCGVVEARNRLPGQRRRCMGLNSYFLSSWGAFIHLEGGHHSIEEIRQLKYSRCSFVSVHTDKGLFWDHCFYQCSWEREKLMTFKEQKLLGTIWSSWVSSDLWDLMKYIWRYTEGVLWNDGEINLRKFMLIWGDPCWLEKNQHWILLWDRQRGGGELQHSLCKFSGVQAG